MANDVANRFFPNDLSATSKTISDEIRSAAMNLGTYINENCTESRETSLALTKLEECVFWADEDLSRNR